MIETLDFVIFIFFLHYIDQIYSSGSHNSIIFASSYLARIIGGSFISILLSKFNIQKIFSLNLILLGIVSIGIALTPLLSMGIYLLAVLRFIQGSCYTLEVPVSLYNLMLKSLYSSVRKVFIYGSLGFLLSILIIDFLVIYLKLDIKTCFISSFIILGVLSFIGAFVRKLYNAPETRLKNKSSANYLIKFYTTFSLFLISFVTGFLFMNGLVSANEVEKTYLIAFYILSMLLTSKISISYQNIFLSIGLIILTHVGFIFYSNILFIYFELFIVSYLVTIVPSVIYSLYIENSYISYSVIGYNIGIGLAGTLISNIGISQYSILLISIVTLVLWVKTIRRYYDNIRS